MARIRSLASLRIASMFLYSCCAAPKMLPLNNPCPPRADCLCIAFTTESRVMSSYNCSHLRMLPEGVNMSLSLRIPFFSTTSANKSSNHDSNFLGSILSSIFLFVASMSFSVFLFPFSV